MISIEDPADKKRKVDSNPQILKPTLVEVGTDVQLHITKWLDIRSLARLEQVSNQFNRIANNQSLYGKLSRVTVIINSDYAQGFIISTNLATHYGSYEKKNTNKSKNEVLGAGIETILPSFLRYILSRGAKL